MAAAPIATAFCGVPEFVLRNCCQGTWLGAYPILFGMLWTLQTLKAKSFNSHWHYSYMDVSLKEIALFAGVVVASIAVSIIYADIRKR
jgi:hypothetical protein